jgi:hypothetical protein
MSFCVIFVFGGYTTLAILLLHMHVEQHALLVHRFRDSTHCPTPHCTLQWGAVCVAAVRHLLLRSGVGPT